MEPRGEAMIVFNKRVRIAKVVKEQIIEQMCKWKSPLSRGITFSPWEEGSWGDRGPQQFVMSCSLSNIIPPVGPDGTWCERPLLVGSGIAC